MAMFDSNNHTLLVPRSCRLTAAQSRPGQKACGLDGLGKCENNEPVLKSLVSDTPMAETDHCRLGRMDFSPWPERHILTQPELTPQY